MPRTIKSTVLVASVTEADVHSIIPASVSDVNPNTNSVSKNDPYDYVGSARFGTSTCRNFAFHCVVTGLVLGGFVNAVIVNVQV